MRYLRRAISAEVLKLRRTAILWFAIAAPLVMLTFYVLMFVSQEPTAPDGRGMLVQTLNTWAGFFLPLLIITQTALLAATERGQHQWQRAFVAPVPRWATYGAKWAVSVAVVAGSSLGFAAVALSAQALLGVLDPWYSYSTIGLRVVDLFTGMCLSTLAALFCISVQLWLALRIKSLVGVFGLGILAFMLSAGLMWSKQALTVVPWVLPFSTLTHFTTATWVTGTLAETMAAGAFGGLLVAALAGWDFVRRDVE